MSVQTPLPEQDGPNVGTFDVLEHASLRDLAFHITRYNWELFSCVHEVCLFITFRLNVFGIFF